MFVRRTVSILASSLLLVSGSIVAAQTPVHIWDKHFGSAPPGGVVHGDVATDASNNVVVGGTFYNNVNFGGLTLTGVPNDKSEVYLAKYNQAGTHLWSKRFGATLDDSCMTVAVDPSGNILVAGVFADSVDFGGGLIGSAGNRRMFIAKYNGNGVHQWSKFFGNDRPGLPLHISSDNAGNVLLTGWFLGTIDFGGGGLVSQGGSPNNYGDVFVAKYNSSGVHQWSKRFGTAADDAGYGIEADPFGNVIISGEIQTPIDFGGGPVGPLDAQSMYLVKFSPSGVHVWSNAFGEPFSYIDRVFLAVDGVGNAIVAGVFEGIVDFGGGNLTGPYFDMFLAKYNSAGAHQWSRAIVMDGFGNVVSPQGIEVDVDGDVAIAGYFTGTIDLGGAVFTAPASIDAFIAKYSSGGAHRWSRIASSSANAFGHGVAVDTGQNVLTTGIFSGTANFGGGPVTSYGGDLFIAKYQPESAEPFVSSIVDIGNDQGRRVNIRFDRSAHDATGSASQILSYEAYRRDDAPPAALVVDGTEQLSRRQLLDLGWTFAGEAPAHGQVSYALDASTIGDSTIALGQYYSVFFIRAATANPIVFYDSPIDSGYSLDNLAPGVPLNFVYDAGDLSWDESTAEDFDFFTVYGSNTDAFGAAVVVDYSVAPTMDVSGSPYVFYYVTATDFSGNEGKPAKINTLSGVGGTPKNYVLSVSNYPNPFNPRTTVSYTVPSRGRVTVSIYDARGAHVARLFDGDRGAGAYTVDWDGRTGDAAVAASGIYFARIEHASGTRSKKMVLLK